MVGLVEETPRESPLTKPLRVGIRAKLVLVLLLTAVPMVALVGWFGMDSAGRLIRAKAVTEISDSATQYARDFQFAIDDGVGDAAYLARSDTIRRFARACATDEGPTEKLRIETLRDIMALARTHGIYAQIRYLDLTGRERARVDLQRGVARPVPDEQLQDKSGRYYFEETLSMGPGPVYVSPLDLNREQQQIQRPLRPVIRFAACVAEAGTVSGVVVLNRDVSDLMPTTVFQGGDTYIVDSQGHYLSHTDPEKAWSGPENLKTEHSLATDLGDSLPSVLHFRSLPPIMVVNGRLIARRPIMLRLGPVPRFMLLCVDVPEEAVFAGLRGFQRVFWLVLLLSVVAAIIPGLMLAGFFLKPLNSLRRAVRRLAEGDLTSTADVRSGDEFRDLANDFNTMARRLQEYQKSERTALVGRMAGGIIHDIRNPLSSVTGYTRVLADRDLPREERQEVAERVMGQVDRIQEMLQEILDFSRGEGGRIETDQLTFGELMADLREPLQTQCAASDIELRLRADVDCTLHADKARLQRAITNITTNACEAMSDGGVLTVQSTCAPDAVVIEVTDTGPGIPAEILDQLMEPFVTHGKANGTGLGLAIARAVIEAHGGSLKAENRMEGGARFIITLPLNATDARAPNSSGYVI